MIAIARLTWFAVPAMIVAATACSSAEDAGDVSEETGSVDQAKRTDPCATVRCAAGTHCVARGRRASCVPNAQDCTQDSDCRLFDNYCDGCACDALSVSSPDPVCTGTVVQCFRQPCGGMTAVCQNGTCAAATAPAGEACGSTTCPSGQVCCNSSCGICTPPGGMCIQLACGPTL